jgi:hypothetical protein
MEVSYPQHTLAPDRVISRLALWSRAEQPDSFSLRERNRMCLEFLSDSGALEWRNQIGNVLAGSRRPGRLRFAAVSVEPSW